MVVGLDLNLSFRPMDLLRDLEKRLTFLINDDTFVQKGSVLELLHPRALQERTEETATQARRGCVMKKPGIVFSAFSSWRETKVSYRYVERGRSLHLFCLLHAQIGSVFSTMILRC
jgi:hypothetical protein